MSLASDGSLPLHVDDLLRYAVSVGASDLHLAAGMPGVIRLHGALRRIEGCPALENEMIRDMIFGILPASQRERFEEQKELDTSHSIAGVGRFRVNVAMQRGTVAAALRPIPHEIPEFDTLGLPDAVRVVHGASPRPGTRHRSDRFGEVDHAGFAHRHHQPDEATPHRDGRGPDRVPSRSQALDRDPAGDRRGHVLVRRILCDGCCGRTRT